MLKAHVARSSFCSNSIAPARKYHFGFTQSLWIRRALLVERRAASTAPFRKHLKDEKRARKTNGGESKIERTARNILDSWELTVGIEVHAQLNSGRKLFSESSTDYGGEPNSNISLFDVAAPGAQPKFQAANLLPALRAALALKCEVEKYSQFDRKHYFYHDQPAGYQITQYYRPFATQGYVDLHDHDGIATEDGKFIRIGIKQVQMEQDTAKTNQESSSSSLIDFNRAGHPLIEIITLPQIHQPKTAAACVKKIQKLLQAVDANEAGIEEGGLRADINVSVRPAQSFERNRDIGSYSGVHGLGQRTEIKNLVSFQAIEDAITAERDRQIRLLEVGGTIVGETRGWTIGSTETTSLRSKEGEVDYRYMADPDLPPVLISQDLVEHLQKTLPELPDETLTDLTVKHGLSIADAKALMGLDNGRRLQYYDNIYGILSQKHIHTLPSRAEDVRKLSKLIANYVLHELGGLLATTDVPFSEDQIPPTTIAEILDAIWNGHVTSSTAKMLLVSVFKGDERPVSQIIQEEDMAFRPLSDVEYHRLVRAIVDQEPRMMEKAKKDWVMGKRGTFMWFVGQVMKQGGKSAEATKAKAVIQEILGLAGDNP